MEYISFESVCRCCLTNSGKFSSIFEIYNDYYMPKVILACTGLTILQSDGLPDVVCEPCLLKLITAYETRRQFLRSNSQLKEQLNRLKQSEQEILKELKTTTAKCGATSALEEEGLSSVDAAAVVEDMLEAGPITTWDNEINMHIEQLQDAGATELAAAGNIEDCLDELVIEKYETLMCDGSTLLSGLDRGVMEGEVGDETVSFSPFRDGDSPGVDEDVDFSSFSEYSEESEEEEDQPDEKDLEVEQEKEEPQSCSMCNKTFRNKRLLQRHVLYHNASKTSCPICSKTFTHTSNLKRHLKTHKPPPEGFTCPKCPKSFTQGSQLYDHLKVHKGPPPEESGSYVMHCDFCPLETTSLAAFTSHMTKEHAVPKDQIHPFRCHLCPTRFVAKQGMLRHVQSVHQNQKRREANDPESRKFLCTQCGKRFLRKRHLDEHTNSHSGDRKYVCECGLSFSQKSGLNLHYRTKHENRKVHTCDVCQKTFAQSAHLKHHALIHSNVKKFECTICGHRFRVKSNLVTHMRVHRKHPYCCGDCGGDFEDSRKLEQHMAKEHGGSLE
ncbi:hypothetical protein pipiens_010792 [Culex pipiens pipiens]|uniref:Zinc finger protein n=1 Tax=Culex pipiens pipiens TaxID=38569 RepID=A0ABD1DAE6_CULPP